MAKVISLKQELEKREEAESDYETLFACEFSDRKEGNSARIDLF